MIPFMYANLNFAVFYLKKKQMFIDCMSYLNVTSPGFSALYLKYHCPNSRHFSCPIVALYLELTIFEIAD